MRTLVELLQLVLDNIDDYKDDESSLCFVGTKMLHWDNLITDDEESLLDKYLTIYARSSEYYKKHGVIYLFKPDDWDSRIKWLKERIEIESKNN